MRGALEHDPSRSARAPEQQQQECQGTSSTSTRALEVPRHLEATCPSGPNPLLEPFHTGDNFVQTRDNCVALEILEWSGRGLRIRIAHRRNPEPRTSQLLKAPGTLSHSLQLCPMSVSSPEPWHCNALWLKEREKEGNYSKLSRWCRRASSQLCDASTGSEPNWGCLLLPTSSSRSTNTGCILRSLLGFCDSSGTKLGLPLIALQHQAAFWETPNGAKRNQEIQ